MNNYDTTCAAFRGYAAPVCDPGYPQGLGKGESMVAIRRAARRLFSKESFSVGFEIDWEKYQQFKKRRERMHETHVAAIRERQMDYHSVNTVNPI